MIRVSLPPRPSIRKSLVSSFELMESALQWRLPHASATEEKRASSEGYRFVSLRQSVFRFLTGQNPWGTGLRVFIRIDFCLFLLTKGKGRGA